LGSRSTFPLKPFYSKAIKMKFLLKGK